MIVPVTVIGSVVAVPSFVPFEPVCANVSGASSAQQAGATIVFSLYASLLMLMIAFLQSP
jgi:hypothetical protein